MDRQEQEVFLLIIFLNVISQFSEVQLAVPLNWDEYRIMIGEGLSVFSQARARGFSDLNGQNLHDFIDYINKIQSIRSGYTLNLYSDSIVGSTILEYLYVVFSYEKYRSNIKEFLIDESLFRLLVNTHDRNIREGISF